MNIVACPKCAAQFDVSTFQPGSTFVCGSCGNVLTVPGAQAPQRPAAPKAPPARRPAAPQRPPAGPGRKPASGRAGAPGRPAAPGRGAKRVDPRRAGGARPAPEAPPARPPSGRAASGRRGAGGARRGGYEKPEKSNLPLVLGGVGVAVVIVVIIAVIALMPGGDDPIVGPGPDVADNGGPTEPAAPTRSDIRRKLNNKVIKYGKDVAQLYSVFQECEKEKFPDIAKIAALSALKVDEDLEWANQAVGKKDLQDVYGQLPDDEDLAWAYKNQALKTLEENQEFESRWGTSDDYDKAERLLREVLDHAQKLRSDQKYVDIWQIRANVAGHVFYSEFPYSVKSTYPYVVFVQSEGEGKGAISDEIVDRNVRILKRLYDEFHRVFGERFKLPKLEDRVIPSERTLKVFTLASEKKFHEYQRRIGQPLPGGVRAYYKPGDQWITLFEGGQWEKSAKKGESSFNINKIFHEGTHQLVHVYTKILMQRERNPEDPNGEKSLEDFDEVAWIGKGANSQQHWFQEGFAELFAASKPNGDTWDLLQMHRNRLMEWKGCRKAKKDEWPFEVMVKVSTRMDMQRRAFDIGLNRREVSRLGSLFYA
ncbi:MAG: hypothetical protein ABFS86_02520, partial [Planctomycetota bacterium]